MTSDSRPVYSTDSGRLCPECGQPVAQCRCRRLGRGANSAGSGKQNNLPPWDGIIRLRYETKGRKGSGVTVIHGLDTGAEHSKALLKTIKKRCGTGGTMKEEQLEIQGDHRKSVKQVLEKAGFTVKGA